jgi:signal transduction histidine kinase
MGAQEKERRYVAQELHDSIASNLAAIKISLENKLAQMGKVPASSDIQLEDIISFVQATINDLRRIMTDLRPAILDDLGILPTIQWHCAEFQKIYPNIRTKTLLSAPEERLAEPLEITIFRILQEAMHNVAKHSNADLNRISLSCENGIQLTIKDNGSGFDLKEVTARRSTLSGLGLSSMKERAELAGGKLYIESSPGAGTTIRAEWPA